MAIKGMKPSVMPKQRMKPRVGAKPVPMPIKPSAPSFKKATPRGKKKGLNDFLKQGKTPPSKNKNKGKLSSPDAIIKGYNDKKTLTRKKK